MYESVKKKQRSSREHQDRYNPRLGYIPTRKGSINDSEHRNILAYLFLSDFKNLYRSPDMKG